MAMQPGVADMIVGRQAELAVIQDHLDDVSTGSGGMLLVSGEAGVGKSRLVAELLERSGDAQRIIGNCFRGDQALAYAPLLDLLRTYLAARHADPDVGRLFSSDPAAFVTLLPEFQTHLADIPPFDGSDPEQEKHRIFQTLLTFVSRLADDQPIIVVIEDLHWCDDASLEFLVHLARLTRTLPVLVVGTFRSDEERPGLRRTLVEIARARLAVELKLARLTIDEVDLLLRDIFDQPYSIRPDFLRVIYELTEGNPFFVEETVGSLIAAGDIYEARGRWTRKDLEQLRIPRSVQDALASQTERLDDAALGVLESAAVVGQRFDFALLLRLADLPEPELLGALRALVDARLIVEESADRFRFRHALIRESVYEQLLVRERRARHGLVAETIEEFHVDMLESRLAELAYHFHAAERWDKAFEYASLAGERAQALFAPHATIEHFGRGLEAAAKLGRTPPFPLLRQRGLAHETLGEFEEARRDFDAALEIARDEGNLRHEWEALIALGRSWEGLDYERAGGWFEQAIELARRLDDHAQRAPALAHSLNRVGTWYCNTERPDEARVAHLEALEIFEDLGDEHGIAATVDYLGVVADIAGDLVEMRARFEHAVAMFERLGDRQHLASTLTTMCVLTGAIVFDAVSARHIATHAEVEEWGYRGLRLAREVGWRAGEAYALLNLAGLHLAMADYGRVFELTRNSLDIAQEIGHREWQTGGSAFLGYLYLEILDFDSAIERLEESTAVARASGSYHFLYINTSGLVDALVDQGRVVDAEETLSAFSTSMPMQTIGQRRLWASRANLALAKGSADEALAIVDRLFATGHNVTGQEDIPLLAWMRGRALAQLGRPTEAEEALLAARDGSAALNQPGKLWRVNLELASFYSSLDRNEDGDLALQTARAIVVHLAEGIEDEADRSNFLASSSALFDAIDGRARPRKASTLDELTPRERDVALLLTRGLANRHIADELFIGERTVETHVSNILSKLGFESRTQIATWVLEHDPIAADKAPSSSRAHE